MADASHPARDIAHRNGAYVGVVALSSVAAVGALVLSLINLVLLLGIIFVLIPL